MSFRFELGELLQLTKFEISLAGDLRRITLELPNWKDDLLETAATIPGDGAAVFAFPERDGRHVLLLLRRRWFGRFGEAPANRRGSGSLVGPRLRSRSAASIGKSRFAEVEARASIMLMAPMPDRSFDSCRRAAAQHDALKLLLLFGSRGRGDDRPDSDWDFGYLADPGMDELELHAALAHAVGTERVDLVDLERASGLLRYRAARDGIVLLDRDGVYPSFAFDVATFWFDAEPVLNVEYEALLNRI